MTETQEVMRFVWAAVRSAQEVKILNKFGIINRAQVSNSEMSDLHDNAADAWMDAAKRLGYSPSVPSGGVSQSVDYEAEVRKVWPDAKAVSVNGENSPKNTLPVRWYIDSSEGILSQRAKGSKQNAWKSAYSKLPSVPSPEPKVEPAEWCPDCGKQEMLPEIATGEFEYGIAPNTVILTATHKILKCDACGFMSSGEEGEVARQAAVDEYLAQSSVNPSPVKVGEPPVTLLLYWDGDANVFVGKYVEGNTYSQGRTLEEAAMAILSAKRSLESLGNAAMVKVGEPQTFEEINGLLVKAAGAISGMAKTSLNCEHAWEFIRDAMKELAAWNAAMAAKSGRNSE